MSISNSAFKFGNTVAHTFHVVRKRLCDSPRSMHGADFNKSTPVFFYLARINHTLANKLTNNTLMNSKTSPPAISKARFSLPHHRHTIQKCAAVYGRDLVKAASANGMRQI